MSNLERDYQRTLIRRIEQRFPGCYILKLDSNYQQGIPDLLILFGCRWAMLEVKLNPSSPKRPNQRYFVDYFNEMSFASFVDPSTEEEVLDAIEQAFHLGR